MKPATYGIQFNPTDRSYTVIVNGVTGRNFKTNAAAVAYVDQHKRDAALVAVLGPRDAMEVFRIARAQTKPRPGFCSTCHVNTALSTTGLCAIHTQEAK